MSALEAFCSHQRQSDADYREETNRLVRQSIARDLRFRLLREEREERQEFVEPSIPLDYFSLRSAAGYRAD